jgi:hypothetical protein
MRDRSSSDFAIWQIDGIWNVALLEILRAAGINQDEAILSALQIQPDIGCIGFYGEFGEKMAMRFLGIGGWRFHDQGKMGSSRAHRGNSFCGFDDWTATHLIAYTYSSIDIPINVSYTF